MEGLHSAIAQCQKAYPHIRLIALLPLSLQIHGQLCRNNGLDVVGLGQCLHLHKSGGKRFAAQPQTIYSEFP